MKTKAIFGKDSVVQNQTNIDDFIPSDPVWNYVRILNHPEEPIYDYTKNKYTCGKWLLFIPRSEFVSVFRDLSKLIKEFKLTQCFKASGDAGNEDKHVFCIYCVDYRDVVFVRKIANVLLSNGFLEKYYSYRYNDGTKAIYFKTDRATYYKSQAKGESLTLFKFTDKGELFVKEFHEGKSSWKLVIDDKETNIFESYDRHLGKLEKVKDDVQNDVDQIKQNRHETLYPSFAPPETWRSAIKEEITKSEWEVLRKKILQRDDYACQYCKFSSPKWQIVHHIDGNPNNNDKMNLMVVCPMCNLVEHAGQGCIIQGVVDLYRISKYSQVEIIQITRELRSQGLSDKEIIKYLGLKKKVPFLMDQEYLKSLFGFITSRKAKNEATQKSLEYGYNIQIQ